MQRIMRIRKATNFVVMDKTHLNDRELSWKGTGLMSYLLGLPDDWEVNVSDLQQRKKDGRDGTYSAMHELIKAGYVVRNTLKDDKGRVQGIEYMVYEGGKERSEAELLDAESLASSPLPAFPYLGKAEQLSNDYTNKDKDITSKSTSGKAGSGRVKKVASPEFKIILKWFYEHNPHYGRIHNGAQAAMIKQIERMGTGDEVIALLTKFVDAKEKMSGSKFWASLPISPRGFMAVRDTIICEEIKEKGRSITISKEDMKKILEGKNG